MTTELEIALARELHEVADGVPIPPMPRVVPEGEVHPGSGHRWQPLLVAAAAVLIVGVVTLMVSRQGDGSPEPAPPGPTRATESVDDTIPVSLPTVPFIVDQQLYVDGTRVPGQWWGLETGSGVWLAIRVDDGSYWWGGPGVEPRRVEGQFDQPPVLSPNGGYVAYIDVSSGRAQVNGFTTDPAGEGFGLSLTGLPRTEDGVALQIAAVTDDGDVIVRGTRTSIMWRTQSGTEFDTVDLSETAPDRVVLQGTPAGLVVVNGPGGEVDAANADPYLATVSAVGALTPGAGVPRHDALAISPGGTWLVRAPEGTQGGDGPGLTSLSTRLVDGGEETELQAPDGWSFVTLNWVWEDDETLLASVVSQRRVEPVETRLVRCRVDLGTCVLVDLPSAGPSSGSQPPQEALDAVVQAAAAGDRAGLDDQAVVADVEWNQLVGFAAGQGGRVSGCRDNGEGTWDCEIALDADPSTTYYAIVAPAENAYGWVVRYVSIGGA